MKNLGNYKFIDIHYHASPDLYERKLTAIAAGKLYKSLEGAVVLRSHLGSTSVQATLAQAMGLPVLPSLILNPIAGGINYQVVLRALAEYQGPLAFKMIVDFPTITGRSYSSRLSRNLIPGAYGPEIQSAESIFNEQGRIKSTALDILKMTRDYPIVLSTGHASQDEINTLVEACYQCDVPSLLINQPAHPLTGMNAADLEKLLMHDFLWVDQTLLTYLIGHQDRNDLQKILQKLPRVIYSSDLGQVSQMGVKEWVVYTQKLWLELDLDDERQREIELYNPLRLLTM